MTRRAALLAMVLAAGACGGGGGTDLEGIYQASTWTENTTTCDQEGASIIAGRDTTFYVKQEELLGQKFLNVKFCTDVTECQTLASDDSTINLGEYGFDQGSDSAGWTSEWYSGFPDASNVCQGAYVRETMTGTAGQDLRIEVRETAAGGFAPDSDGFCDDAAGKTAAEGQPCTRLEVITATYLQGL